MPRRSKYVRRPVPRKEVVFGGVGSTKLRAVVLLHFENKWASVDPAKTIGRITVETGASVEAVWGVLCAEYPGLAEGDLAGLGERCHYAELVARRVQRDEVLRERLALWPAAAWATIFIERPDWETELTAEQAARWQAFLERVRRDRLRETQSNVIAMQPKRETIQ